jgi:hypothetical protein
VPLYFPFEEERNDPSIVLPSLINDMDDRMKEWGTEGVMDPFVQIYDVGTDLGPLNGYSNTVPGHLPADCTRCTL